MWFQRHTDTERQTDRETDRQRDRQTYSSQYFATAHTGEVINTTHFAFIFSQF